MITEKQSLVDEMELQLMNSAPESTSHAIDLREHLTNLYDEASAYKEPHSANNVFNE